MSNCTIIRSVTMFDIVSQINNKHIFMGEAVTNLNIEELLHKAGAEQYFEDFSVDGPNSRTNPQYSWIFKLGNQFARYTIDRGWNLEYIGEAYVFDEYFHPKAYVETCNYIINKKRNKVFSECHYISLTGEKRMIIKDTLKPFSGCQRYPVKCCSNCSSCCKEDNDRYSNGICFCTHWSADRGGHPSTPNPCECSHSYEFDLCLNECAGCPHIIWAD